MMALKQPLFIGKRHSGPDDQIPYDDREPADRLRGEEAGGQRGAAYYDDPMPRSICSTMAPGRRAVACDPVSPSWRRSLCSPASFGTPTIGAWGSWKPPTCR